MIIRADFMTAIHYMLREHIERRIQACKEGKLHSKKYLFLITMHWCLKLACFYATLFSFQHLLNSLERLRKIHMSLLVIQLESSKRRGFFNHAIWDFWLNEGWPGIAVEKILECTPLSGLNTHLHINIPGNNKLLL